MRLLLIGFVALSLSGCAQLQRLTGLAPETQALISCIAYTDAADIQVTRAEQGKLSPAAVQRLKNIDARVGPVCRADNIYLNAQSEIGKLAIEVITSSKLGG